MRRGRLLRAGVALAVAGVVAGAPLGARAVSVTTQRQAATVTLSVTSVSPSTPRASTARRPLAIALELSNNSGAALSKVTVSAQRGDPIGTQQALNESLADSSSHTSGLPIQPTRPVTVNIPAHATVTATFRTTTSLVNDEVHLCLCHDAVYPIDLSAHASAADNGELLGATRTYLPSFDTAPKKLPVTWLWPLIDRPHRIGDGTEFIDDDLTTSVGTGRLNSDLQVVEAVAPKVPITLVIDPELLAELHIMSTGKYTVRAAAGPATPGTGQQEASDWLARLRLVLTSHPDIDLELTPYADPDVTGLSRRGLSWSTKLSSSMAIQVEDALGDFPASHTVAWPPGGRVDRKTLDSLAAAGADTVVLDGSSVRPSTVDDVPVSVTQLNSGSGRVNAALTSPAMEADVQAIMSDDTSASRLPQLIAELAIRIAQSPQARQPVILTAPRYVYPAVQVAARVILDTSISPFSAPVTLTSAATSGSSAPRTVSSLRAVRGGRANLPSSALDTAASSNAILPHVHALLDRSQPGRALLSGFPSALQSVESAAFSPAGSVIGGPDLGRRLAASLSNRLHGYLGAVRIVKPKSGSYTLASSNSALPITVRNGLPYVVAVRLSVSPIGGLPGFFAKPLGPVLVQPDSKGIFHVPTQIQRSGRIPVEAELTTPDGEYSLGGPVKLFVHSTVLGLIGVVITIVAGVVLALALLVRYIRRVQRLRRSRGQHKSEDVQASPEHERSA